MERFIGVDDARGSLGRLVEEVATSGDVGVIDEALATSRQL
jgi:hypothetical protein